MDLHLHSGTCLNGMVTQELLHFHISYTFLELLCSARPKDVAVVRFMSLKDTVGVYGMFQH